MPRKMRNPKARIEGISDTALWVMGDRVLYPKPAEINEWELIASPSLDYPTCSFDACKALWDSAKEQILKDWIRSFPGARPSYWWLYDSPRMSAEDIARNGWQGCYYGPYLCEPRIKLGGIGTANHEVLNYTPSFHCGIPDSGWVTKFDEDYYNGRARDVHGEFISCQWKEGDFTGKAIDPDNPPRFESQATYLERHGLLVPGEQRRLQVADYEPEVVVPEESEDESSNVVPWPVSPGIQ